MRRLLVICLVAVVTALLAVPAPARAAVDVLTDGVDTDVPARMDIVRVRIDNGTDRVVLRLRFRDLTVSRRAQTKVFIGTRPGTEEGFIAYSRHRPATGQTTQLWVPTDQEFGGTPVPCPGMRGRWDFERDVVRMVVPQSCLASTAPRYRFKAVAGFYGLVGDFTSFRRVARG